MQATKTEDNDECGYSDVGRYLMISKNVDIQKCRKTKLKTMENVDILMLVGT